MKKLLFLFCLLAGVARAEDKIHFKTTASTDLIATYTAATHAFTFNLKEIVQNNLCPSGWKESKYWLVVFSTITAPSVDLVYDPTIFQPNIHADGNVEVCPDNGLIRVKQ